MYLGKGQSAIEYLMTYGWMLLVVAVVGGAVFSVTQNQSVESVSGFTGSDIGIDEFGTTSSGQMQIEIRNTASDEVKINSINISDDSGKTSWTGTESISISETGLITLENVSTSESGSNTLEVTINYDSGGLKNLEASGTISGDFEISGSSEPSQTTEPKAEFSVNASDVKLNETIEFNGSLTKAGSYEIVNYSWDFGDGQLKYGELVEYSYNQSGQYNASLEVEDEEGNFDSDSLQINVSDQYGIDDFEDGDLDEYSVDPSHNGGSSATVQTSDANKGEYLAELSTTGTVYALGSTQGLEYYPSAGNTIVYNIRFPNTDNNALYLYYGVQSETEANQDSYRLTVRNQDESMTLNLRDGGSSTTLEDSSVSNNIPSNEWLKVGLTWYQNGTHVANLYDSQNNSLGQVKGTDSTYTSGGIGFGLNNRDSTNSNAYIDNFYFNSITS